MVVMRPNTHKSYESSHLNFFRVESESSGSLVESWVCKFESMSNQIKFNAQQ